jgi:UDP-GlcNAc:undecaprenyl-phosphate GlcNAc-1-phosphate transferase
VLTVSRFDYLAALILAFVIVGFLTPLFRSFAIRHNIWDAPTSQHKTHKQPVPYLGGVAIALGVTLVCFAGVAVKSNTIHNAYLALTILLPALLLGVVGLFDDIKNLSASARFIYQTGAGVFISIILISQHNVGTPSGNKILDGVITTMWVIGISNSINFFDNLDGGAAGTVCVSSSALALIAYLGHQYLVTGMATVIAGATAGFLLWNKSPARIYMGDAGALFLGVLMATLTIRLEPTAQTKWTSFATPLLLLAVPILDTSVAVSSRIRRKVSPFRGGRDHLSHRFVRSGLSRPHAAITLWALSAFFAGLAIIIPLVGLRPEEISTVVGGVVWLALYIFFMTRADS